MAAAAPRERTDLLATFDVDGLEEGVAEADAEGVEAEEVEAEEVEAEEEEEEVVF